MRWLVVLVVVSACFGHPHVALQPPPPSLTPTQRVQAFESLRGVTEKTEMTTSCHRGACSTEVKNGLVLANGIEVWHAEDIAPVIAADSAAARHLTDVRAANERRSMWGWVAFAGAAGGIGGAIAIGEAGASDRVIFGTFLLGVTTFLVGGVGRGWNTYLRSQATRKAFETYNDGVARRLGLCVIGLAIVPCEAPMPDRTALGMRR